MVTERKTFKENRDVLVELAGEQFSKRQLDVILKLIGQTGFKKYNILQHEISKLRKGIESLR